jgi:flagellar FliJ protein
MADTQPLDTLLEQATGARDSALDQHRRALSAAEAARRQGEQLAGYRQDYVRRFGLQSGRAGSVELLQCYQGFMARLDDAVAQQEQIAVQAARRAEDAHAALLAAELRVASVRKLIERRAAEELQRRERADQKAGDEFASRAAWQRIVAAGRDGFGFGMA